MHWMAQRVKESVIHHRSIVARDPRQMAEVLRELDEPAQLKAAHLLTARLMIMPFWNVLGLVLLIVEAIVRRNEPGFSLLVAASALWVAAAAFTFTFMFSLNSRLARADSTSSPKQSLLDYQRWSARHLPRLLILAAALLCLLLAVIPRATA